MDEQPQDDFVYTLEAKGRGKHFRQQFQLDPGISDKDAINALPKILKVVSARLLYDLYGPDYPFIGAGMDPPDAVESA